uniref:Uncharacterized protein n=1 Tax=Chromera velia CCMP2878 TaxID=1169474 RepID=A0A0G4HRK0_9ALVE|eukprot:Cvel_1286.t1-p1 / transcript=Cvel_1286.t1 / gene=Cvel_1286 / organism=Chromera_velia_CCMP2878 / gene_product=hypothetical protein / transcript_product=hypothetical protein / location=Cvel_scaffold43:76488-84171(+) / protein_length=68 / sequence_SO=supercontig / SO=protein_coding / is_pseudo=false
MLPGGAYLNQQIASAVNGDIGFSIWADKGTLGGLEENQRAVGISGSYRRASLLHARQCFLDDPQNVCL